MRRIKFLVDLTCDLKNDGDWSAAVEIAVIENVIAKSFNLINCCGQSSATALGKGG